MECRCLAGGNCRTDLRSTERKVNQPLSIGWKMDKHWSRRNRKLRGANTASERGSSIEARGFNG